VRRPHADRLNTNAKMRTLQLRPQKTPKTIHITRSVRQLQHKNLRRQIGSAKFDSEPPRAQAATVQTPREHTQQLTSRGFDRVYTIRRSFKFHHHTQWLRRPYSAQRLNRSTQRLVQPRHKRIAEPRGQRSPRHRQEITNSPKTDGFKILHRLALDPESFNRQRRKPLT